ncbi:MAG TPA: UDP-3-O-(3-hydroxymyristoyl)glucosamine N-acyltransferase [Candidatus Sulfotelmatobacter sp.]|nr:UDP-3-O-(3-hydroxymyristoyl)glucosamine N-acyltransferase [Candidatus Sulfotelmatobacter sp.]
MKLSAIAAALHARVENSSSDIEIKGLNGVEEAGAGELTFVSNPKYAQAARTTKASAVILAEDFPAIPAAMLRVKDPYLSFARALELFHPPRRYAPGVHPTAVIDATARIGEGAHIGPYVVIGEKAVIGANAVLLAHVVIYPGARIGNHFFAHAHSVVRENSRIGDNVLLQNGVVIGSDGFGFAKTPEGHWHKIPQPSPVVIGDEVEVQANSCIDRASVGETRIGRGVKVDNLVQVGHGTHVGEDALLCAQVGLAGSTVIGNRVILTGQVGVVGHCTVGDNAIVTPQTGVAADIAPGALVSGSPAVDHRAWLKYSAILPRLPELVRMLRAKTSKKSGPPSRDGGE